MTYWRGLLGMFIMLIMVAAPSGLLGLLSRIGGLRRRAIQGSS